MSEGQHDPFTMPTPKGWPPYHLRDPDPVSETRHIALMTQRERAHQAVEQTRQGDKNAESSKENRSAG